MNKRILFFCLLASFYFTGYGQTQRLVLIEEATNASCGPCAAQNPGFDALLNQNRDKLTAIKYHWYYPGYDPMYNQNTVENLARVAYYGINGVPTAMIDGVIENRTGFSYPGSPAGYSQAIINEYAAIPSPFEIDLYHRLSANQDSIYVTMRIRAAEDFSGSLKAQMAVVEKHINFTSPPGTNGEKNFLDVMKKMLPDHLGTTLPVNWQSGDYLILTQSWKLQNIYNMSELGVVGFIQNATTKSVKQAANSSTEVFAPYYNTDVALTKISNLTETNCMGKISPKVILSNFGLNPLTSVDIVYHVNGENQQIYNWTGNLDYLGFQEIELPEISFSVIPANEAVVYLTNPNGTADEFHQNDTIVKAFNAAVVTPNEVKLLLKLDNNPQETTWDITNSEGTVVFSGGPYTQAGTLIQETFQFTESDCYVFTIYDAGGNGLAIPGFFALFYGGNNQIISGTAFGSKALAQFEVDATVGFEDHSKPVDLSVYPNPVNDKGFVSFTLFERNPVTIEIFNSLGQSIKKIDKGEMNPGNCILEIGADDIDQGIYFIKVSIGAEYISKKITVLK
jgi:hypothetical protein